MSEGIKEAAIFTFPMSPDEIECPYPYYEKLRHEAPVYQNPSGGEYIASRHADIVWVLQHPEIFSNMTIEPADPRNASRREVLQDSYASSVSVAGTDPPDHKAKRALMYRGFTPGRLRAYEDDIRAIAEGLIANFVDRGRVEFMAEFAYLVPMLVICRLLGLPAGRLDDFVRWTKAEGQAIKYHTGGRLAELQKNAVEQDSYLRGVVEEKYRHPQDDFLSELIQAQVAADGKFNLPYILGEAALLFFAGNVTTAHTLGSSMLLLLQHQGLKEQVLKNPALLKQLWEETLRLEPPVQWLTRRVVSDMTVGGVPIAAGSKVILVYASGNHDEDTWQCPVEVRLGRKNIADHLAFGHGIHFCLGAPLARLEGRIALETFLARVPNPRLAPRQDDIRHIDSYIFRAPKELHLEFDAPGAA
jgi:cytochrome P450